MRDLTTKLSKVSLPPCFSSSRPTARRLIGVPLTSATTNNPRPRYPNAATPRTAAIKIAFFLSKEFILERNCFFSFFIFILFFSFALRYISFLPLPNLPHSTKHRYIRHVYSDTEDNMRAPKRQGLKWE